MKTPFYFVRHGQTDYNVQNILTGQTDVPLNQNGINQAQLLQQQIHNLNFGTIYSSPLSRAFQTASILNEHLNHKIIQKDNLKERSMGVFEGNSKQIKISTTANNDNHIENYDLFKNRVLEVLSAISEENSSDIPLVVSHNGVFIALKDILNIEYNASSTNCGIYLFTPSHDTNHWSLNVIGESSTQNEMNTQYY